MDQSLPPRLPAQLESAVQRVRMAAREAAEQTVDSLGLAALATHGVAQRDALLGAQYELNRKLAVFALTFDEAVDTDVARQTGTLVPTPNPAITPESLVASWESLSLVDDHEMDLHVSADRFALEIGHACEWEIRELDGYMASLVAGMSPGHDGNPLRAEVVAQAMMRAIAQVCDRPEVRKVLATEIGRSLAQAMRQTYADIVADLRHAGIQPMRLTVRPGSGRQSVHGALSGAAGAAATANAGERRHSTTGRLSGRSVAAQAGAARDGGWAPSTTRPAPGYPAASSPMGRVDSGMMSLIRRLNRAAGAADGAAWARDDGAPSGAETAQGGELGSDDGDGDHDRDGDHGHQRPVAPNLINAHRSALHQAARGALDHRVIDVIAGLFDEILSDAAVPPQLARQIARLQLPVLRAALGDSSFFSSRRHPVRRFVNRVASIGSAVDDFDGEQGRALLQRVTELVQGIVDGDFEQAAVYEQQLQALEAFIESQSRQQVGALAEADSLLAGKEDALRVQQQFGKALDEALEGLPVPDYLRGFMAGTWSQAIAHAEQRDGGHSEQARRLRDAGRALVLSVQPKGAPAQRQAFVRALPQLMKDLNHGLDLVEMPAASRQAFFDRLLPEHAQTLKAAPLSTLDLNLLTHRVERALATPLPRAADLPAATVASGADRAAVQAMASPAAFSAAEARAIGLVDDSAVDWSAAVDIDLGIEPEIAAVDIDIDGLPPAEAPEPSRGKALADHLQLGQAYRMHLEGQWRKVRLDHVSPSRGFFVFSHGHKRRSALSLTYRMLLRMCEAGRLRGFENAYLIERATARARRQLATLLPARR